MLDDNKHEIDDLGNLNSLIAQKDENIAELQKINKFLIESLLESKESTGNADIILEAGSALLEYYKDRQKAKKEEELAMKIILEFKRELKQVTEKISNLIEDMKLADLRGKFETASSNFNSYRPDKNGENAEKEENQRLLNNTGDICLEVIGYIKGIMDNTENINTSFDFILKLYPIYLTTLSLYVMCLTERKFVFNIDKDFMILNMMIDNRKYVAIISKELIKKIGSQYGDVAKMSEEGIVYFGYYYKNRFIPLIEISRNDPRGLIKAEDERDRRKQYEIDAKLKDLTSSGENSQSIIIALTGPT